MIYRVTTFHQGNQNGYQGGARGGRDVREFADEATAKRYAKDAVEVRGCLYARFERVEAILAGPGL